MTTDLRGKRIALIGGAGFIGHNLALALKSRGASVDIVDSLQVNHLGEMSVSPSRPNRDLYTFILNKRLDLIRRHDIPVHIMDARDYQILSPTLNGINPDVTIHLAAIAHAGRANKDPYSTFDHNLRTLENVLDGCRGKISHFIYFSSSMVYGNFEGGEVTEESRCEPIGIYGALKLAGEKIVVAYNQVFDLPYTIIRPSALYGERCVSRRVAQILIENALMGKEITVNGDGSDRLDFTYVKDLIQGVIRVIDNDKAKNQTFNITYGESRSIGELVDILTSQLPGAKVRHAPRDDFMPERGTLCVDKARELIGYRPEHPLDKGYLRYIKWYKELAQKHGELFREAA